jgi:uncharacterized C2H2 Zn-finger protein
MSGKNITLEDLDGAFWTTPGRDHADHAAKNHVHLKGQPKVMLCGVKKPRNSIDFDPYAEEVQCERCKAAMKKLGISLPHWKD